MVATWETSLQAADGNTVIDLCNGMKVVFVNNGLAAPAAGGTRVESFWELQIPRRDGSLEKVHLVHSPHVE